MNSSRARRRQFHFQALESRRLLAASLEAAPSSLEPISPFDFDQARQPDFESDPRLVNMFHGPRIPGRAVPPIQGVALKADFTSNDDGPDSDFPWDPNGSGSGEDDGPAQAAPFPLDQTFNLHSRPDSNFTIYLDFDGHTTVGTSWNTSYGIDEIVHPNYWNNFNNNFSSGQLELVQNIWRVVTDDFAPFDVNVTTEEPTDLDDLKYGGPLDTRWGSRVVMTKDSFASCGCGGHAFLGSFDDPQDEPALVYNGGLNAGSETVSHEVGHQLGLNHDGLLPSTEYYRGHGSGTTGWGPIMGAPFSKQITHWNDGDYFDARNTSEDDLAIITGASNFPYVEDDHANDRAGATSLRYSGVTSVSEFGIIERNDDVDWFSFTTEGGDVSFDVDVLGTKPNLDVWVGLFDSSGNFIVDSNPQTELSASLSNVTLTAGEYFLQIDGVARDGVYDEATGTIIEPTPAPYTVSGPLGYSDYGSLGQYRISGTVVASSSATVSIAADSVSAFEGDNATFTLTTSDGSDADVTVTILGSRQLAPGTPAPDSADDADFGGPLSQVVSIVDGTGTLTIPLVDDASVERDETFEVHITDPGTLAIAEQVATFVINESKTAYSIFAEDAITIEGDPGAESTHEFLVGRLGRQDVEHTVSWQLNFDGSDPADATDIASALNGSVTFAADETEKLIQVQIAGDIEVEANETYSLELLTPQGNEFLITSARSSASGRIDDDESVVSLARDVQFRVRQLRYSSGNFDHWAIDDFQISGTAINDDFDPEIDSTNWDSIANAEASSLFPNSNGNSLFFNGSDGDRTATTIPVSPAPGSTVDFAIIFADQNGNGLNATESGEDAVLEYSLDGDSWTSIQVFAEDQYITWTDLSVPLPEEATFEPAAFVEGDAATNSVSVSLSRVGFIDKPIAVDWTIGPTGSNPVDADDFGGAFPSGTVSFSTGQTSTDIVFDVTGDDEVEPDETFQLTLTSSNGGPILADTLTAILVNDDFFPPDFLVTGLDGTPITNIDLDPSIDDGTDFGLIRFDADIQTRTFTIENNGDEVLNLTGVAITSSASHGFSVTQPTVNSLQPTETTTFDVAFDPSTVGPQTVMIEIANDIPLQSNYQFAVAAVSTDLVVESIVVDSDAESRSQLTSVDVTFNQLIDHAAIDGGVLLRNLTTGVEVGSVEVTPADVDGKTTLTLNFGSGVSVVDRAAGNSLTDGRYELQILAANAITPGANSYPMFQDRFFGTDGVTPVAEDAFFRLFGDSDADADVDLADWRVFSGSLFSDTSNGNYRADLDFDGDNDIDGEDLAQLRGRLLSSL